uniref:Uncharacterized protein n=1 Tax=Arion vulgaris TaxID=1028688 RepID=A0A0B7A2Q6_9EUPU
MHTLRHLFRETEHLQVCPECCDIGTVTNSQNSKTSTFVMFVYIIPCTKRSVSCYNTKRVTSTTSDTQNAFI